MDVIQGLKDPTALVNDLISNHSGLSDVECMILMDL